MAKATSYFYCAMTNTKDGTSYLHGVMNTDAKNYDDVVDCVSAQFEPPADPKNVVILSFNRI